MYLLGTCLSNEEAMNAIKQAVLLLLRFHVPKVTTVVDVSL